MDTGMSSDARLVRQLADEWKDAALRFDVEAAASFLAPEFTMATNRGSVIDVVQWKENLGHRIAGVSGEILDAEVRVYGEVALMMSRWRQQATFDGKDWSGETYITDVWVRRDGRWQVVRSHATAVDPEAS